MTQTILTGAEATNKMKAGIDTLTDIVAKTLGAKGRTIIIDRPMLPTIVTKDGVTVVKAIEINDAIENIGSALIRDASIKTLELVGDGTTTVCVLARAIFNEGLKLIAAGYNAMEVKKGIEAGVEQVVAQIKKLSVEVDDKMLLDVATVSANNDAAIGKLVSEAYNKIGKDGIITIEDAKSPNTEIKIIDGLRINKGFLDPFYINNQSKMTCELKKVAILLYDREITTAQEVIQIVSAKKGVPLLIICGGLEGEAYATVRTNRVNANYPICVIEAPYIMDRSREVLEDIAILTGATVISEASGYTLDKLKGDMFGDAETITTTQAHTTIVGGGGDKKEIKKRIESLKKFATNPETRGFDKVQLQERAAKMENGVAVMYVAGVSQVEINEKKDRCDDAVRATKAALEEGVVPGGGFALLSCKIKEEGNKDFEAGMQLVAKILSAPLRQMCENAGLDAGYVANKCIELGKGYNFMNDSYEDLSASGILDPAKVCRVTLEQAASVAGTMLTSAGLVCELPKEQK